jgi:cobalt-precorrin 5A hydrolase
MNHTAVIALERFSGEATAIARAVGGDYLPYSTQVFAEAFKRYPRIIAYMATGIAVRGIAPLLRNKWVDPAVVVVSPGGSFAIPILGGHHGANDLARELAVLGITPVITTATETYGRPSVETIAQHAGYDVLNRDSTRIVNAALLEGDVPVYRPAPPALIIADPGVAVLVGRGDYVVGVGCRKGAGAEEVCDALRSALKAASLDPGMVLVYATTRQKLGEEGLLEGVRALGGNLVFLDDATLNRQEPPSASRASMIGLVGVAEPAALALAKRQELVLKKHKFGGVTVAIAR